MHLTRRRFLRTTALATLAAAALPRDRILAAPAAPRFKNLVTGRKIRLAFAGVGGRGAANLSAFANLADACEITALCDVDIGPRSRNSLARFPLLPRYRDYRHLLDEMHDRIDALVISTPDHMHCPIALAALRRGKHVYVEKPMSHTIGEAHVMAAAAAAAGAVTQMGNQGAAVEGPRLTKEWLDAGTIGTVREVHCWTDRPVNIWPQGMPFPRPDPVAPPPVPPTLEWDLWQGVAPEHAYDPRICPGKWRGLLDHGCGALGDMGCHVLNAPFFALDLRGDCTVTATHSGITDGVWPLSSVITYDFPARGSRPPLKLVWYDGGKLPPVPPELDPGATFARGGALYIGDNGKLLDNDYGSSPRLIPAERNRDFAQKRPPKTLPRVTKGSIYKDWLDAIADAGPAPCSNFAGHATALTEFVLLGNLALLAGGKPVRWDSAACAATGRPDLDKHIHKTYRTF
jgi:hypothetical protein